MRFKISDVLHKKYKVICVKKDLSVPKQTTELIRKFVEIQEENEIRMKSVQK